MTIICYTNAIARNLLFLHNMYFNRCNLLIALFHLDIKAFVASHAITSFDTSATKILYSIFYYE